MDDQLVATGLDLRAKRRERFLTQAEAAKEIGISVQSVRLAERGVCGLSNARKIQGWIERPRQRKRGK